MNAFFRIVMGVLAVWVFGCPVAALEQEPVEVALVGRFAAGPVGTPVRVTTAEFRQVFGSASGLDWPAEVQAGRFFAQGGTYLHVIRAAPGGALSAALAGSAREFSGMHGLQLVRDLGIVFCPELTLLPAAEFPAALAAWKLVLATRRATMILDPPPGWTTAADATAWVAGNIPPSSPRLTLYFPYLHVTLGGISQTIGSSGTLAAAWLQNDAAAGRGVWTSPAGTHLLLATDSLSKNLSDAEQTALNNAGIGMLRFVAGSGIVPWGARHLDGGTTGNAENRFIAIQRTLDWIGTNMDRFGNTQAVHRANDAALWTALRGGAEGILSQMHIRGVFAGTTPNQNYFVQCGLGTTMTQQDIENGKVILLGGVALIRPSEFIILRFEWNNRHAMPLAEPMVLLRPGSSQSGRQLFHYSTPGASLTLQGFGSLAGGWDDLTSASTGDGTWSVYHFETSLPRYFLRLEQAQSR